MEKPRKTEMDGKRGPLGLCVAGEGMKGTNSLPPHHL